tara:strand:- start:11999 stop:12148 length:150 start_codon:yes stop_codon:yes gene_type:complete
MRKMLTVYTTRFIPFVDITVAFGQKTLLITAERKPFSWPTVGGDWLRGI